MAEKNIRVEIQKVLDEVPESLLENVLLYLKEVQKCTASEVNTAQHLKKILSEDRDLLKKLAQ